MARRKQGLLITELTGKKRFRGSKQDILESFVGFRERYCVGETVKFILVNSKQVESAVRR